MKILVFSDTHLCLPFEEKKFRLLEKIINSAGHVIINGVFWDGYMITEFFCFLTFKPLNTN